MEKFRPKCVTNHPLLNILSPKERKSNNTNTEAREGIGKVAHKHASQTLSLKETKPRIGNPQL